MSTQPAPPAVITGKADLRDQAWLADQVDQLGSGIAAARAIWSNWDEGRHVGRLYPSMSAGAYIASLGLRLELAEAMAALPDGSARQVAAVAGVSEPTVRRARGASNDAPAKVIGSDGKSYPGRVVRPAQGDVIEPIASGETLVVEGPPRDLDDELLPAPIAEAVVPLLGKLHAAAEEAHSRPGRSVLRPSLTRST